MHVDALGIGDFYSATENVDAKKVFIIPSLPVEERCGSSLVNLKFNS